MTPTVAVFTEYKYTLGTLRFTEALASIAGSTATTESNSWWWACRITFE